MAWVGLFQHVGGTGFRSLKISKMEKSIIFASFLLILSITTTFPKNCNYDTQISN
jgi:hypothetical protein